MPKTTDKTLQTIQLAQLQSGQSFRKTKKVWFLPIRRKIDESCGALIKGPALKDCHGGNPLSHFFPFLTQFIIYGDCEEKYISGSILPGFIRVIPCAREFFQNPRQ